MIEKVTGPECPRCGSQRSSPVGRAAGWRNARDAKTGEPITGAASERRRCAHCGHNWSAPVETPAADTAAALTGATWSLPRCPSCTSADVPVQRTEQQGPPLVQRRKCAQCGHSFKSVGQ